ncbi:MAG: TonB-dependent receptor [Acidobacteriaceae bacterium]|nr:TonB-dependent receptor [Acidobacteriaceae bacterium]
MRTRSFLLTLMLCTCNVFWSLPTYAADARGSISGVVADAGGSVLPGARVELQPGGQSAVSSDQGRFTIQDVAPGHYTLNVSYVGFSPFTKDVDLTSAQALHVDAVLEIGMQNEVVTVRGGRQRGEVEAINIERTADNIIQVLPSEVITSLPNTNIADAVGRLPSVSLERDEGEGKYIQIRGTEPRLSNVTINGIHVPSPENVRNVKLDVIPADLVEMVEISKTLSANQDADAVGGSVNLVTRTPSDEPYVSFLGMGGYTPISGGRNLYQLAGTAGQRFGVDKKFGLLFGGSYDYNARGINDLEPAPAVFTLPNGNSFAGPNTEDMRNYHYDRKRYGFEGEADYKLGQMSSVYLRGLFSRFMDNGEDWIYSPGINNFVSGPTDANNTCGITNTSGVQGCGGISFSDIYRQPEQRIFSFQAGARHVVHNYLLNYELALSQARYTGGFPRAGFNGPGSSDNGVAFGVDTTNPFIPKFPVLNSVNLYDPSAYALSYAQKENDSIFERDVVGDISLNKPYSVGSNASSIEIGLKGWDARKSQLYDRENYSPVGNLPMTQFLSNFRDNNYYFGSLNYGPVTEFSKIQSAINAGQISGPTPSVAYNLQNAFDISERIWAGYVMNTISLGRFRLQAGLRIESTQDSLRANLVNLDGSGNFLSAVPQNTNNSYINAFPSLQAQYRVGTDTILRAAYGMGIARPNFGGLAPYFIDDPTSNPEFSKGNPNLKPTHAQNFDLLVEHYLQPFGIIQAGVFYKSLTDPIYSVTVPFQTATESTLINGPNAHIIGFEAAWQQRLSMLPRPFNGMGISANYGYTASRATFPNAIGERTDHPTLVRTAPNNWNFDVTYDKKGISARMGLTHNDAYIWSYSGGASRLPDGDTYLYPHTQVDAQVSYWIPRGHGFQLIVSALNLNNEVFGFYNGSEKYPIQREYYGRTVSAGLRWTLPTEHK